MAIIFVMVMLVASIVTASTTMNHYKFGGMNVLVFDWVANTDGTFTSFETRNINGNEDIKNILKGMI